MTDGPHDYLFAKNERTRAIWTSIHIDGDQGGCWFEQPYEDEPLRMTGTAMSHELRCDGPRELQFRNAIATGEPCHAAWENREPAPYYLLLGIEHDQGSTV